MPFSKLAVGGTLTLGQTPDLDRAQSFSGEISQVGIWDSILSPKVIEELATCRINKQVIMLYFKTSLSVGNTHSDTETMSSSDNLKKTSITRFFSKTKL